MKPLKDQVAELRKAGYGLAAAQMKAAHDTLLLAMHRCGFKKSSTVKGGVVMSHISKDIRRTTMDMDIAFVHRSISEASIRRFVSRLNCIAGIRISIFGTIGDLHHEDYNGKRAYIDVIDDSLAKPLRTKLDIGVHAHKELAQIVLATNGIRKRSVFPAVATSTRALTRASRSPTTTPRPLWTSCCAEPMSVRALV